MEELIEWVEIGTLKPNPKNRNQHSQEQIERLAKIIKHQGWRHPIIVSKNTGFIVAGHGRLSAAKEIGLQKVPVHYQSFENEDQEYAFLISDNSIASWAELDLSGINLDLGQLGPEFDIELLGLKDFLLEPADKFIAQEHWSNLPEYEPPNKEFRIIVYLNDENKKNEFLELINAKDYKEFEKSKIWSLHWPQ